MLSDQEFRISLIDSSSLLLIDVIGSITFSMSLKITKKLSEWYGLFWLIISDFIYANLALFLLGLCMIRQITVAKQSPISLKVLDEISSRQFSVVANLTKRLVHILGRGPISQA